MQASVIVSTYNRRELILRTVRTLLQQDFPASEYEIIVVVDGSRDGTADALRALGQRVRVLEQENRGLAGARNSGARSAISELLIFLDDDMECVPQLVREHVAAHNSSDATGEAGPDAAGEFAGLGAIYAAPESPRKLAADYFSRGLGAPYLRQREHTASAWPQDVWSFGNTSIRRSVLQSVGGFNERFRMREDGELGARLRDAGVRQRFVPGAVAYQWCDKSTQQLIQNARAFAEFDLLFMQLHPDQDPHGLLTRVRGEEGWKRRLRSFLVANPPIADLILAPLCVLGERLPVGPLREAAVRALLLRCGLHWLHELKRLSGSPAEEWR